MEENCDMQIYSIIVLNLLLKDHRKHMQKKPFCQKPWLFGAPLLTASFTYL